MFQANYPTFVVHPGRPLDRMHAWVRRWGSRHPLPCCRARPILEASQEDASGRGAKTKAENWSHTPSDGVICAREHLDAASCCCKQPVRLVAHKGVEHAAEHDVVRLDAPHLSRSQAAKLCAGLLSMRRSVRARSSAPRASLRARARNSTSPDTAQKTGGHGETDRTDDSDGAVCMACRTHLPLLAATRARLVHLAPIAPALVEAVEGATRLRGRWRQLAARSRVFVLGGLLSRALPRVAGPPPSRGSGAPEGGANGRGDGAAQSRTTGSIVLLAGTGRSWPGC